MKKFFAFVLVILFLSNLFITAQGRFDKTKLDSLNKRLLIDFDIPGMAVGVIYADSNIFAEGYGKLDVRKTRNIDSKTLFGIASLSKAFTAAAIGILVDEGKIKWDDKVIEHYPALKLYDPYITRELTIIDILSHRTGYRTFDGDLLWYATTYSREEVIERFSMMKNKNSFRSKYGYSNLMFIIAGKVIEEVSGMSWEEFITKRIFAPLEMVNSTVTNREFSQNTNAAIPHIYKEPQHFINYENAGPAASINSCIDDLSNWARMWLNKGKFRDKILLQEKTVDKIFSSQMSIEIGNIESVNGRHFMNTGLGWFLNDSYGRKVVSHSGGLPGFISLLKLVPEEDMAVIVLTNDDGYVHNGLTRYIIDAFIENEEKDYFTQVLEFVNKREERKKNEFDDLMATKLLDTKPSLTLEDYAGNYLDEYYGEAEVKYVDGSLILTLIPTYQLFASVLEHFHFDTFIFKFNDPYLPEGLATFDFDKSGKVKGFSINLPNPDFHFDNLYFIKR